MVVVKVHGDVRFRSLTAFASSQASAGTAGWDRDTGSGAVSDICTAPPETTSNSYYGLTSSLIVLSQHLSAIESYRMKPRRRRLGPMASVARCRARAREPYPQVGLIFTMKFWDTTDGGEFFRVIRCMRRASCANSAYLSARTSGGREAHEGRI